MPGMARNARRNLELASPSPGAAAAGETVLSLEQECEHLAEMLVELEERHFVLRFGGKSDSGACLESKDSHGL